MKTNENLITPENAERFRANLNRFAFLVAYRRIWSRWSDRDFSPLCARFEEEAMSAAHEWIARTPNPATLVCNLAETVASEWPRDLFRFALSAVNRLIYRVTRRECETVYLDVCDETFSGAGESFDMFATPDQKLAFVARRCAELRERARAEMAGSRPWRQSYIRRFLRLIDRAEAYAAASIRSETFPFRERVSFHLPELDWQNMPKETPSGRNTGRIAANLRAIHLGRFIALLDARPDPAAALVAAWRVKLGRFADRVLRDRRRMGTLPAEHEAELKDVAISAAYVWAACADAPADEMARLTDAAVNQWPKELYAQARREVTKLARVLREPRPTYTLPENAFAECFQ